MKKNALLLTTAWLVSTSSSAGIPVVGGPLNVEAELQRVVVAHPELASAFPELAEKARQAEAEAYNRKKAEDLRNARVQGVKPATPVPAADRPAAARQLAH